MIIKAFCALLAMQAQLLEMSKQPVRTNACMHFLKAFNHIKFAAEVVLPRTHAFPGGIHYCPFYKPYRAHLNTWVIQRDKANIV